eukprot:CAMPEP_0201699542 /NCGR_PEP_ID=MMETSP0578-20130828/24415_1 /ASSEMBLY_ACC=CAM_ASM_000663 /TAXON_ID=267565 /ORGANISM="Skeletonema grethea, Strain CCMP 1804" /LENGTH=390 /DNA_ID=CAMNT_0048186333 /DNA_START=5 /DNA_END=1177 /DNA_ORIENTATION=+
MSSILDSLTSLPAYTLFHITWVLHSIRRPLLLTSLLCLLSNPTATIAKCKLFYTTFLYLAFCQDKKFSIPKEDASQYFGSDFGGTAAASDESSSKKKTSFQSKTVILIRHGESTWNDTFNPGGRNIALFILFYIPNMIKALLTEAYFFISGNDSQSWFFDSALSTKGVAQVHGLRKFLQKEQMRLGSGGSNGREEMAIRELLNVGQAKGNSMVVSSNLRRAISTAAIGLSDRFAASHSGDDILLLPSLQEISFNPDAQTILPPRGVAHPTWCDPVDKFSKLINTKYHNGNKSLDSTGLIRLNQFASDIFSSKCDKDVIVAVGHSLFFRSFFQMFLPRSVEHISKKKKIVNGGTVVLTLGEVTLEDGEKVYMIDPKSIVVVYGGFGKHTKK